MSQPQEPASLHGSGADASDLVASLDALLAELSLKGTVEELRAPVTSPPLEPFSETGPSTAGAVKLLGPEIPDGGPSLADLLSLLESEVRLPPSAADTLPKEDTGRRARRDAGQQAVQHVVFALDETQYAIPIQNVLEISRPPSVTAIPNVPDWLLGIANLRGDIVSIVDLRRFLGMTAADPARTARLMMVRSLREDIQVGFIVDGVREIAYVNEIARLPESPASDQVRPYLTGIAGRDKRMLVLLDPERLLLSSRMRQFETVAGIAQATWTQ